MTCPTRALMFPPLSVALFLGWGDESLVAQGFPAISPMILAPCNIQCHFGHFGEKTQWNQGYFCQAPATPDAV